MRFDLDPSQDLGLQHVLRNGLAVLRGEDVAAERREKILDGLLDIVREADRGSEAMQTQSLAFALDQTPAFDRFSLFVQYLGDSVDDIGARLAAAKEVLEGLEGNGEVAPEARQSVIDLLSQLVSALEQERALSPLTAPGEIDYN